MRKLTAFCLIFMFGFCAFAFSADPQWPSDCYAPATGHPTSAEKTSFVNEISVIAKLAEKRYGVPAAALTAMACNESGFGWTRIGYYANNFFGFKWTSTTQSEGRTYYTLANQPASDPNNKYIKFTDKRDCVMFVAKKLATSSSYPNYKAVTDKYKADIANGVSVQTAVNTWVAGIQAAGYNPNTSYVTTTKKFLNNYMSPSTTYSSTYNLYKYSSNSGFWILFDAPWSSSYVSGTAALTVSYGSGTVTSVKFYSRTYGSTGSWYLIATDTASPFTTNWATEGWVANGQYNLKAEAYNGTTLLGSDTIMVTVQNTTGIASACISDMELF